MNRYARSLAECGELTLRFYLWLHLLARWLFSSHPLDALCRWKELCRVWGNGVYLAWPSACCHDCGGVFCPAPEFGENDFRSLHGQDLYPEDWATLEAKVCVHPLYSSFPSCVVVHSISCWFGDYPLHSSRVNVDFSSNVDLSLPPICEKETTAQDRRKVLPLSFRLLYHKQTFSLLRHLQGVLYQFFRCFCAERPPSSITCFLHVWVQKRCLPVEQT